jgi:predicted oxidoreductase
MKTIVLPGTEWEVSQLAYGCGAIGGTWDAAPLDAGWRRKGFAALDAALEAGITFFDHADIYTFGKSEQVFGDWLAARPDLRDSIFIQSKCGIRFEHTPETGDPQRYDFSCEHIVGSVEGSLKRLGIDYLDVLLLHRPDPLGEPEEVARALDELEQSGKVRRFGVSNHTVLQMELLRKHVRQPLAVNQLQLSLAQPALIAEGIYANQDRGETSALATGILDYCRLHGMLVQAWSPLGGGNFFKKREPGEAHPKQALIDAVRTMAEAKGCVPEALFLAWLWRHPAGIQPVIGSITPERIAAMAAAENIELSRNEWYLLLQAAIGRKVP